MSEDLKLDEMSENIGSDEEPILKKESTLDNFDIPNSASEKGKSPVIAEKTCE